MARGTGQYRISKAGEEKVRAFVPLPLPPADPPLLIDGPIADKLQAAEAAVGRLSVAAAMVPSEDWFLYGFVRKEAVISSQIEGTQASLKDIIEYEATSQAERPDDVEEVCNYVDALVYARKEIASPKGLPISARLLCQMHKRLMKGVRGSDKQPGTIRKSQNWIGGTRPGNAIFVPPPPDEVAPAMGALEKWIHTGDSLPPLVRAGLAHVQFETIHPFLDGNGRLGRLLITILLEHWKVLSEPLLYLSLAFKQRQQEYYQRLSEVRRSGDWEGWTVFFLECVRSSAEDAITTAEAIFRRVHADRAKVTLHSSATVTVIRLFEQLPSHPLVTVALAMELLETSKPTAIKSIQTLEQLGILVETTGKRRDRAYAYAQYLKILMSEGER